MLEEDDQAELARHILTRYTIEDFSQPDEWRTWLERNRDRLFFTDTGGYKFLANRPAGQPSLEPTTKAGGR
jgi:hypothetical protein